MWRWADSFDAYQTGDVTEGWTQLVESETGSTSAIGTYGRRGTQGWRSITGTGLSALGKTLTTSGATCIIGMAWKQQNASFSQLSGDRTNPVGVSGANLSAPVLMMIRQASAVQGWLTLNQNGTLAYYDGDNNLLGTTTNAVLQGQYYYIELKVLLHASTGTVDVHVNNDSWLSLTNQATEVTGSATWDEIWVNKPAQSGGQNINWDIDDLYAADGSGADGWTDFKGDLKLTADVPIEDGANTDWTPLSGSDHWAMVDDIPPDDDTTYNYTTTLNARDSFVFPDADASETIYGVQIRINARRTDAGAASVGPVIRMGSTNYDGTGVGCTETYSYVITQYGKTPDDSGDWALADYNDAEFGYKKTA